LKNHFYQWFIIVFALQKLPFKIAGKPYFMRLSARFIRTMHSTCLEDTKKMPYDAGIPLAAGYISETVAWIGQFFVFRRLLYNKSKL